MAPQCKPASGGPEKAAIAEGCDRHGAINGGTAARIAAPRPLTWRDGAAPARSVRGRGHRTALRARGREAVHRAADAERADPAPGTGARHPAVHPDHPQGRADRGGQRAAAVLQIDPRRRRGGGGCRPADRRRGRWHGPGRHHPAGGAGAGPAPARDVRRRRAGGRRRRVADVAAHADRFGRERHRGRGDHLRRAARARRCRQRGVLRGAAARRAAPRAPAGRRERGAAVRPGPRRARRDAGGAVPGLGPGAAAGVARRRDGAAAGAAGRDRPRRCAVDRPARPRLDHAHRFVGARSHRDGDPSRQPRRTTSCSRCSGIRPGCRRRPSPGT